MRNAGSVAIIDDDEELRLSLGRLMRAYGIEAKLFESADAFLASGQSHFDCVIADVHMPLMSGIELYRHLLYAEQAIPTILVTAYPNEDDRAEALNEGVVCYLPKPIDERILKRCLREALGSDQA